MRRAALLTSAAAAIPAAAAGFTVAASAALFGLDAWARDSFRLWSHPYFADGLRWMWAWWPFASDPATRAALGNKLWLAGAAGLLPVGFVAQGLWKTATETAKAPLHGESRFATRRDAECRGICFSRQPRSDAILLGKWGWGPLSFYVGLPGQQHAAVYAPTEAGKGVSIVVPNCLNWGGSLVAFSIKRDLVRDAAAERARKGDATFVFDLTAPDGRTHRWNPLGMVRRGTAEAADDVQKVMFALVPETKATNPYWDNAGRRIATALGYLQAETPGAALTVPAIAGLIRRPDAPAYLRRLIADARAAGRPYPRAAVETILGWCDGAEKDSEEARGVRQTILTALGLWEIPRVAAATATSDFDLRRLRQDRMSVFVCAQPDDFRRFRPIYALFFRQLISAMSAEDFDPDRHSHNVLAPLDEFWALGEIKELADAAAFVRSSGLRLLYVMQSKNQTVMSFGQHGSDNLFANVGAEIVFGGVDQKLAKEISERGDNDTVTETTRNRPRFMGWAFPAKQSESEAARRRALMLPQEVKMLPEGELLVLRPKLNLLKLRRIFWFSDPAFRDLAGPPPDVPRLNVVVERDAGP